MGLVAGLAVLGAVADIVAKDAFGGLPVTLSGNDGSKVESWRVLVRGREQGSLGSTTGQFKVAGVQSRGGDRVGNVDHGAHHVLVDADAVGQPSPPAPSLAREGLSRDQAQRRLQVAEALGTAGLSTRAKSAEQIDVSQDADQLVDAHASGDSRRGLRGVGQVVSAGRGIDA